MPYIREQMLPGLAARHFTRVEGRCVSRSRHRRPTMPDNVLYRSDPDAPRQIRSTRTHRRRSVGLGGQSFFFRRPLGPARPDGHPARRGTRLRSRGPLGDVRAGSWSAGETPGRWRLLVQHQSGSLEAGVSRRARRQNHRRSALALLLLLTSASAPRAQPRAARTVWRGSRWSSSPASPTSCARRSRSSGRPPRTCRTAWSTARRSREALRAGCIETEARRLGEMVETRAAVRGHRVRRSATGARVPLAPTEIIERAIDSSIALLGRRRAHDRARLRARPADRRRRRRRAAVGGAEPASPTPSNTAAAIAGSASASSTARPASSPEICDHRQRSRRRHSGVRAAAHLRPVLPRRGRRRAARFTATDSGSSLVQADRRGAHGGRVPSSTRAGAGSSFTIALPSANRESSASAVASQCRPRTRSRSPATKAQRLVSRRILLRRGRTWPRDDAHRSTHGRKAATSRARATPSEAWRAGTTGPLRRHPARRHAARRQRLRRLPHRSVSAASRRRSCMLTARGQVVDRVRRSEARRRRLPRETVRDGGAARPHRGAAAPWPAPASGAPMRHGELPRSATSRSTSARPK